MDHEFEVDRFAIPFPTVLHLIIPQVDGKDNLRGRQEVRPASKLGVCPGGPFGKIQGVEI
jgi:hypothetical protein